MTDPFTKASPTYIAAQRTNQKTGEPIDWQDGQTFNPMWLVVLAIVLIGGSLLASVSV